ncbi:CAP domain-containing protein [Cadophora sp. MPI-SDFR-AT-0126]|nr:CAP domain-containing protein [Leotiomycetes sp. MPI-SDFR-AT-0126]
MSLKLLPTILLSLCTLTAATPAEVVTITASSTAPSPTSPSYTDADTFQKDMLTAHNFYRGEHGVKDLVWNETSAEFAADWVKGCRFEHSGGPTGENLAAGYANATASVDAWGLERTDYNFKKPTGFSEKTGHFTQLVWGNTTSVGCAVESCQGENDTPGFYVVCEYYPPGNVVGNNNQFFKDNVLKQDKGKDTDTVESGVTSAARRESAWMVGVLGLAVVLGWGIGL